MDDLRNHINSLREDFTKGTLNESDVQENPALQFENWLQEAIKAMIPEVQAMTLSTVSEKNKPSSRIVYLREFDKNCFVFYGNYSSKKGKHLNQNPNACINFFWPELERQIRIEGVVVPCNTITSDSYFNSRPLESKLGAWASQQSELLQSRKELEEKLEFYKKQFEGKEVSRPSYWGGWVLKANYYEFWQGRKSRLHDRISYTLEKNNWIISRLSP